MKRINFFGIGFSSDYGAWIAHSDYLSLARKSAARQHIYETETAHLREKFKDVEAKCATILVQAKDLEHRVELAEHNAAVYKEAYIETLDRLDAIAHQRDEYKEALEESHSQYAQCALREKELQVDVEHLIRVNAMLRNRNTDTDDIEIRHGPFCTCQEYAMAEWLSWNEVLIKAYHGNGGMNTTAAPSLYELNLYP